MVAGIRIRVVESAAEYRLAQQIRTAVFVQEQAVPAELEVDAHESDATHLLATLDGVPVAAARHRRTANGHKLERVAVLREQRGRGIGAALVRHVLAALPEGSIYVHAQLGALPFWEHLGFVARGEPFEEAGIAHRVMWFREG